MEPGLLEAYVLHRRPYGDTSYLLELLTREQGRVPAIAKGVAGKNSLRKSLLQAFAPLYVSLSGRGEVKVLSKLEARGNAAMLSGKALICGFYVNELMMRLTHREDPHESLFDLYEHTLQGLAITDSFDHELRRFELGLLDELGFGLDLEHEAETGAPLVTEGFYHYRVQTGLVPCAQSHPQAIAAPTLLSWAKGNKLDTAGQRQMRNLMRQVLGFYLGDKPLKSRELFI